MTEATRAGSAVLAAILVLEVVACFVLPAVAHLPAPVGGDILQSNLAPGTPGHLLGTDLDGNDVVARLLAGGRASIQIALSVNLTGLAIGGLLGIFTGLRGGTSEMIAMRLVDVLIAFPPLVLSLAIAQSVGPSTLTTIGVLSLLSIPAFSRVARAATLQVRQQEFVLAAALSGTGKWRIALCHILPLVLPQLVTFSVLGMGTAIVLEGALSYLGLGVQPPYPSWGNMIQAGQMALATSPRLLLFPSALLFITVLSLNVLSESLRRRWSSGT